MKLHEFACAGRLSGEIPGFDAACNAKVMFHDFPMDAMPPVMKDKFVSDVKSKIETAKQDHKIAGKVTVDLVDGATGRVMATVSD